MSLQIHTNIIINATPEKVWAVLTDFPAYPEWNSFIRSIRGEIAVSNTIQVDIDGMKFSPRVLRFSKYEEFQWKGKLFIPGLFDGKHRFFLSRNADGTTLFIQEEEFSGILIPFLRGKLQNEILPKFNRMNEELKARVERL